MNFYIIWWYYTLLKCSSHLLTLTDLSNVGLLWQNFVTFNSFHYRGIQLTSTKHYFQHGNDTTVTLQWYDNGCGSGVCQPQWCCCCFYACVTARLRVSQKGSSTRELEDGTNCERHKRCLSNVFKRPSILKQLWRFIPASISYQSLLQSFSPYMVWQLE